MRFSLRSWISIAISLVACETVIGGWEYLPSSGNIFRAKIEGLKRDCLVRFGNTQTISY